MSASAIIMMIVMCAILWGGLVASIVHLRNHPDDARGDDE